MRNKTLSKIRRREKEKELNIKHQKYLEEKQQKEQEENEKRKKYIEQCITEKNSFNSSCINCEEYKSKYKYSIFEQFCKDCQHNIYDLAHGDSSTFEFATCMSEETNGFKGIVIDLDPGHIIRCTNTGNTFRF